MTKAEEIKTLKEFVATLPRDSYVRDALEPFLIEFERGVYSDYVPTVSESWRHRLEAEAENKEARKQLETVEAAIKQAKARLRSYCVSVSSLVEKAEGLKRVMADAVTRLEEAADASDSLYERTANI